MTKNGERQRSSITFRRDGSSGDGIGLTILMQVRRVHLIPPRLVVELATGCKSQIYIIIAEQIHKEHEGNNLSSDRMQCLE